MIRVSREVREHIAAGLDPENVGTGTRWHFSKDSYVRAVLTPDKLVLEVVIDDLMLADVRRGAKRPGVRKADMNALDELVSRGPELLVERLSTSVEAVLNCGNLYEDVVALTRAQTKLAKKRSSRARDR